MTNRSDRSIRPRINHPRRAVYPVMILIVLAVILISSVPAEAQWAYPRDSAYVWLAMYEQARDDSLTVNSAVGLNYATPIWRANLFWEFQRSWISWVNFDGRVGKDRVATTFLTMWIAAFPISVIAYLCGASQEDAAMIGLSPFGSALAYRPTRWLTVYAGMTSEIMLFTEQDGVITQPRLGIRLDRGVGLTLAGGIQRNYFWGWESPSRAFPVGYFFSISYFSPIGSALLD